MFENVTYYWTQIALFIFVNIYIFYKQTLFTILI